MSSDPKRLKETPSQTAGPYVHIGCLPNAAGISGVYPQDLGTGTPDKDIEGERIIIEGVIYDGQGAPVRDAMIEFWQADAQGKFNARGFTGWSRTATDPETGLYRLETIKPGTVSTDQAPHITVWIAARGINVGLHTRLYFADEAKANKSDPILGRIAPKSRMETLLAEPVESGKYRFDIHLQGIKETVFLDM